MKLQNTINNAEKMLCTYFLMNQQEGKTNQEKDFLCVFDPYNRRKIFGSALFTIRQWKSKSTWKPTQSLEENLTKSVKVY